MRPTREQLQAIDTTRGIGRKNIYFAWNSSFSACSGNFTRSHFVRAVNLRR